MRKKDLITALVVLGLVAVILIGFVQLSFASNFGCDGRDQDNYYQLVWFENNYSDGSMGGTTLYYTFPVNQQDRSVPCGYRRIVQSWWLGQTDNSVVDKGAVLGNFLLPDLNVDMWKIISLFLGACSGAAFSFAAQRLF
jgi:hypothetical protein